MYLITDKWADKFNLKLIKNENRTLHFNNKKIKKYDFSFYKK
jgi:hypothetical protein